MASVGLNTALESACIRDTTEGIIKVLEERFIMLTHINYGLTLVLLAITCGLLGVLLGYHLGRTAQGRAKIIPLLWM